MLKELTDKANNMLYFIFYKEERGTAFSSKMGAKPKFLAIDCKWLSVLKMLTGKETFKRPLLWRTFFPIAVRMCLKTFFCSLMGLESLQTIPPVNFLFHSEKRKC